MQDNYGFTGGLGSHDMEDHGPQTTEWEDALVKHKIISKRIKVKTVDQLNTEWREENKIAEEIVEEHKIRTLEEIDELEDDVDEMTLLEYRYPFVGFLFGAKNFSVPQRKIFRFGN